MLTIDDSDFTPDHIEFLREWAHNLGISVEVLLARIVLATSEGDQYVEEAPEYRPLPRDSAPENEYPTENCSRELGVD
jgi:hypothetical protein